MFLLITDIKKLKSLTNWPGAGAESREKLLKRIQNYLPPQILLPPGRLDFLLEQARHRQLDSDSTTELFNGQGYAATNRDAIPAAHLFADITTKPVSKQVPLRCIQTIEDHCDEVLFATFSKDGKVLVTTSKDSSIKIWAVDDQGLKQVSSIAFPGNSGTPGVAKFNKDDTEILVCGSESEAGRIVIVSLYNDSNALEPTIKENF